MTKATKLMMGNILVVAGGIALIVTLWILQGHSEARKEAERGLEKQLAVFRHLLKGKGAFRLEGEKLMAGDYVINGNFEIPDVVQRTFGGTATIFMGKVRISTNVRNPDGARAVGSFMEGDALESIFDRGEPYRGESDILGTSYIAAYDPIVGPEGEVIGALHVGVREGDFLSSLHAPATEIASVGLLMGLGLAALSAAFFRELRISEERYRTVFETTGTATFIVEEDMTIRLANTQFAELLGVSGSEIEKGIPASVFLRSPDLERVEENHRARRIDPHSVPRVYEFRFFPLKEEPRDVLCTVSLIPGTTRSVISLTDLTELKAAEKKLKMAQLSIDSAQACIYRISSQGKILFANEAAVRTLGYSREELLSMTIHDLDPNYPAELWPAHWEELKQKKTMLFESSHRTRDGKIFPTEIAVTYIEFDGEGHNFAHVREITERKRAYTLLGAEKEILGKIASGTPLAETLSLLCTRIEEFSGDSMCSVLLLDREKNRLRPCAGPGLPPEYNAALRRVPVGPAVGSCGTAAYRKEQVIVTDIASDPLWDGFRELPLAHGLRACWSTPIVSAAGELYGTFAVYYRTPGGPQPFELQTISHAVDLARIAIERQRGEETLRQIERRQKEILDNIPDLVWLKDREGRFAIVNKAFGDACGLPPEAIVGKTDLDVFPHDLASRYRADDQEIMSGSGEKRLEEHLEDSSGRRFWIDTIKRAIHDGEGKVVGTTGMARNIDHRKRTEEALRQSEERFRQIFHQNEDAVLLIGLKTLDFIDVNPRAEELYGYSRAEFLRSAPWRLLAFGDLKAFTQAMARLPQERGFHLDRLTSLRQDGSKVVVSLWAKVIQLHDDEVLYCSVRDITERIRIEGEMKATQARLIHANKMATLGMLVSGIAHEINNPNNFISVNSGLLADLWRDVSPILREFDREHSPLHLAGLPWSEAEETVPRLLDGIGRGSDRIAAIVKNLRGFVLGDTSGTLLPIDLPQVVKGTTLILTHLIHKHTDHFESDVPEDLPPALGNFHQIEQVLINLISNALQSLPGKSAAVTVRAWHEPEGDLLALQVRDEGRGMSRSVLEKVTEPFFSTRLDEGGTGLGLFISASIVRAHNGSLQFESEPGGGTTATLRLPAARQDVGKLQETGLSL